MIVDFGTGRFVGGHNADYLVALQRALEDAQPMTVAPFQNGLQLGRIRRYKLHLETFLRALGRHEGEPTVVIVHSPEFRDIVLFWLATKLRRRSDAVGLFLFRRHADGIVGRDNWRARLLERIVPALIRSGWIYPVSDSQSALAEWTIGTGSTGALIAIPPPLGSSARHPHPTGGPVVGLVGSLRIEKGARHYDEIIRETLATAPTTIVKVQVSNEGAGELADIAGRLVHDWATEPRVELLTGHLTPEAYADLIGSTDVVVLPYEPSTYSSGTSGVVHDTLALGRVVLTTRIAWAEEAYAGHGDVIWLQGTDRAAIRAGLKTAFRRAMARRDGVVTAPPPDDTFADDWHGAIRVAARNRKERSPM
jgi:hypothetical protein